MKLLRFGEAGKEAPGMIDEEGHIRDLSEIVGDISGSTLLPDGLARIKRTNASKLPIVDRPVRLGPCVGNVGKLMCIGLNYVDHIRETKLEAPKEPVLFMKATSALCGPDDDLIIPHGSVKTDWEVELAVIIGKPAKHVTEDEALDHVAGYALFNDVSEREWQIERGGQWTKGKSADTFGPLGPWLVTPDEIDDPQNLPMFTDLNGKRMQDGNTGNMVFGIRHLISYLSRFMTLQTGDVIATGTPHGVGMGMSPQRYLRAGDRIAMEIRGLGRQEHKVVDEKL